MDRREWLQLTAAGAVAAVVPAAVVASRSQSLWDVDFGQRPLTWLKTDQGLPWLPGVAIANFAEQWQWLDGDTTTLSWLWLCGDGGRLPRVEVEASFASQRQRQLNGNCKRRHRWLLRTGETEYLTIDTRTGLLSLATTNSGWE